MNNEANSIKVNGSKVNKWHLQAVKEFLESWLEFAETGKKEEWLEPSWGLCSNFMYWLKQFPKKDTHYDLLGLILEEEFPFDLAYPFGATAYFSESKSESHHKNPERLAWVRKTIKRLENDILETTPEENNNDK